MKQIIIIENVKTVNLDRKIFITVLQPSGVLQPIVLL